MKLAINLATRKRSDLLKRTLDITLKNLALGNTFIMVSADHDDEETQKLTFDRRVTLSIRPREDTLGGKYNRILETHADVYMAMVDYAPIITPGFDQKILDAASIYPDGYACVVGPLANLSFACIEAVTAKFAEKMGGLFPPYFPYWFIDHWVDDVAQMTGRMVLTDAISDFWTHRPGTMERREPGFWGTFYDAMSPEREAQAAAMINAADFDDTPARKRALLNNFPRIRQRSCMINDHCRQNNDAWDDKSRDERYARIKANAVRVLQQMTAKAA